MTSDVISEALVVWTGWGQTPRPIRDDQRVVARFGEDSALDLLPILRRLETEFFESDAHLTAADLVNMGEEAASRFRGLHPELWDDAIESLVWCYTYTYK